MKRTESLVTDTWAEDLEYKIGHIPGLKVHRAKNQLLGTVDALAIARRRLGLPEVLAVMPSAATGLPHLRDYQRAGIGWLRETLARYGGAVLADEMGLGKTAQTIHLAKELPGRKLIICPAYVRNTWEDELRKWGESDVCLVTPKRNRKRDAVAAGAEWTVCSYEMAAEVVAEHFRSTVPGLLVMDEAHQIKGRSSQRSKTLEGVAAQARYVMALTGTPMWNRPRDLYKLLRIVTGAGTFGSAHDFDMAYCGGYINQWGGRENRGATRTEELKARLAFYMLRREKKDVAKDLPALQRQVVWVDEDPIAVGRFKEVVAGSLFNKGAAMYSALEATLDAKVDAACALAAEARQFLLFTYTRRHAHLITAKLNKEGTPCHCITGELSHERRAELAALAAETKIGLVATIDSLSTGVNLQGVASVGIFHALDYVPLKIAQAEARLHRLGQQNAVTWYYVAMKESADVLVVDKIIHKLDQWRAIIGQESNRDMRDTLEDSKTSDEDVLANMLREEAANG